MTSKVQPRLLNWWCQNDVKSAARCRLLNRWPRKPVIFGEQKNKEQNGKTPLRTRKYFEWIIKQLLLNSADLRGCYPPRPSASVDNILLDLQNSSYPTQPHSIIANYYSFKIFSRFWLVKTTRIIHHNQLLFTKVGKNLQHIESMTSQVQPAENYWTDDVKMKSKLQPAVHYWTVDLGTSLCYIWWTEKQRA